MMKPVKITELQIENVKRVQAVSFEVSADGLTLIGGDNAAGKTSILDSIAFALGGNGKKPSRIKRDDSQAPPKIKIVLSNGLVVERKGKNSTLTVTDPSGEKGGQALLNSFISELALDLPKFMESSDKKKAETLLSILGVGEKLAELDHKESEIFDERTLIGRDATAKKNHADEMAFFKDLPEVPVSAQDLLDRHQKVLLKNAENDKARSNLNLISSEGKQLAESIEIEGRRAAELESQLEQSKKKITDLINSKEVKLQEYNTAKKTAEALQDESTEAITAQLRDIEDINTKIRSNLEKSAAIEAAEKRQTEYKAMTKQLDEVREQRIALLEGAELPLPQLGIESGKLVYKGQLWDCMSGAEQLIVSAAIVRKLKPECGFVLTDKLEQMDSQTLASFNEWLIQEGLQNIGTTVGHREECQIIISDGKVAENRTITKKVTPKQEPKKWGNFS